MCETGRRPQRSRYSAALLRSSSATPSEWRSHDWSQQLFISRRDTPAAIQIRQEEMDPAFSAYQIHEKILLAFNVIGVTDQRRADLVEYCFLPLIACIYEKLLRTLEGL